MKHTRQELKELALGVAGGSVFTDRHIRGDPDRVMKDARSIFLPLVLMDEDAYQEFANSKPALLYCPMSEASPRSVDGYPIFLTLHWLDEEELPIYQEFSKQLAAFVGAEEEPVPETE